LNFVAKITYSGSANTVKQSPPLISGCDISNFNMAAEKPTVVIVSDAPRIAT
jgi:hypothetical protein